MRGPCRRTVGRRDTHVPFDGHWLGLGTAGLLQFNQPCMQHNDQIDGTLLMQMDMYATHTHARTHACTRTHTHTHTHTDTRRQPGDIETNDSCKNGCAMKPSVREETDHKAQHKSLPPNSTNVIHNTFLNQLQDSIPNTSSIPPYAPPSLLTPPTTAH